MKDLSSFLSQKMPPLDFGDEVIDNLSLAVTAYPSDDDLY